MEGMLTDHCQHAVEPVRGHGHLDLDLDPCGEIPPPFHNTLRLSGWEQQKHTEVYQQELVRYFR